MNDDDIGKVIYRVCALGGMYPEDITDLESWLKQNGLTSREIEVIRDEMKNLGANIEWRDCEASLRNIVQGSYVAGSNELELLRSLCEFKCL